MNGTAVLVGGAGTCSACAVDASTACRVPDRGSGTARRSRRRADGRQRVWCGRWTRSAARILCALSLVLLALHHLAGEPHTQHVSAAPTAAHPVTQLLASGAAVGLADAAPAVAGSGPAGQRGSASGVALPGQDVSSAVGRDVALPRAGFPPPIAPADAAVACLAVLTVALVTIWRRGLGCTGRAASLQSGPRSGRPCRRLRARPGPPLLLEKCVLRI